MIEAAVALLVNRGAAVFSRPDIPLAPMGHMSEAVGENSKALELDPLSLPINNFMG
jgi:hypothetical protein